MVTKDLVLIPSNKHIRNIILLTLKVSPTSLSQFLQFSMPFITTPTITPATLGSTLIYHLILTCFYTFLEKFDFI